jgi:digeranylgeranylglycerophospholipid reductase
MFDALVVGSGPAGSHAAYLLAKFGYNVILLEGKKTPKKFINCTGILGLEAFQKFDLWRVPILNRVNKIKFISPGGKTFVYQSDSDLAYVVERIGFDSFLRNKAINAGASFINDSWVTKVSIKKDRVKAEVSSKDPLFALEAKVAVIATGFNSRLIEKIGLKNPPEFIEAAQADVYGLGFNMTEVYLGNDISPGSFAWFVPLEAERALVGLTTKKGCINYLKKLLNRIENSKDIAKIKNLQCSRLPLSLIPKGYAERILVIGEAAGQVKTTTNGGIFYGMIGANLAVQVLNEAFQKNNFNEAILSQYDQLWKTKLAPEINTGLRLRKLYSNLTDSKINLLFNIVSLDGIMPFIRKNLNFDWHHGLISSLISNHLIDRFISSKMQSENVKHY